MILMWRDARLTKRETLPVADTAGQVLGSCTISKYTRKSGEAYNEIKVRDREHRLVAEIRGYGLHSRVRCSRSKSGGTSGQLEGNSLRINSKDALTIARIALEHVGDADDMLAAIQQSAETLAEQRRLKRAKP